MLVLTWNVNGLRKRAPELTKLLQEHPADVVCLQEIKCTAEQVPDSLGPLALAEYQAHWHGGPGGYSGVALLLRKKSFPTPVPFGHPLLDREHRVVHARAGSTLFASFYVPNGGKDYDAKIAFMKEMAVWVGEVHAAGDTLVLSGDLNVAFEERDVHPSQRDPATIGQRAEERELLRAVFDRGLVDVCRKLKPDDDRLFTWWPYWRQARQRNLGWRLDYVLVSGPRAAGASSMQVLREYGSSDHAPVLVELSDDSHGPPPTAL